MGNFYEVIITEDIAPMRVLLHKVESLKMHWHDELEIIWVLQGSINLRIRDETHILRENDIYFVNSKEIHNTSKTNEENMILALQIHPGYYTYFHPEFPTMRFNCNSINSTKEQEDNLNIIRHFLAKIVWGLNKKAGGYRLIVGSELNCLAAHLINNCEYDLIEDERDIILDNDIERLQRILKYINDNIEKKLTLTEVAEREQISPYYLSHFFKGKVGLSFQEYLNTMRLEKAIILLSTTNHTITDIVFKTGFSSTGYFNKIFRETYNCTPSEYRQNRTDLDKETQSSNNEEKRSMSYLDVDRSAAFKKMFKYLELSSDTIQSSHIYNPTKEKILLDINKEELPYKPYWKNLMTLGRAAEGLRASVQKQLKEVQREIQFKYIRFHGIFMDEMMIYNLNEEGEISYNWTYVNELFDFFMDIKLKPFIGLGFMPSELRSSDETIFWWKGNISPPKDIDLWKDLIKEFIKHCINRYGLEEVKTWKFEVWNEPEFQYVFWAGTQAEYFEFYKETTLAIKSISKDLKVGGPAITHGAIINSTWLDDFLLYCNNNDIFLDFVSIHIYPEYIPEEEMEQLYEDIANNQSALEEVEIKKIYHDKDHTANIINQLNSKIYSILDYKPEVHITEWNASSLLGNLIHDTAYVATFITKNVLECIGKVDSLGYWASSDIFEEKKLGISHFHGGFGLINKDGLKKSSYYAYYLLNKLGQTIVSQGEDYIITKDKDNIQILGYNYVYFDELFSNGDTSALSHRERYRIYEEKSSKALELKIKGLLGNYKITRYELNRESGSVFDQWLKIGAPENMTKEEINYLKGISKPRITIKDTIIEEDYTINLHIPVHGIELITLAKRL